MLRYFRINDPYRLVSLVVIMTLASIPLLIDAPDITVQEIRDMVIGENMDDKLLYVGLVDRTPPLLAVVDGFVSFLFGRSLVARHLMALLILCFQAGYFAILLINNRAYNENTYVPSLIFGLLGLASFDFLSLTPELLASTLILLALNNILKEIEFSIDRDSIPLNLGMFIGLASLIVLSYSIFLVGAILILIFFARISLRKILLVILGFFMVHGILLTIYYFVGHPMELWRNFYLANLSQVGRMDVSPMTLVYLAVVPGFFFLVSLFMLTREARFTRYQTQIFQVLFIWLLLAGVEVWFAPGIAPHSFITFMPPLAYFISHYLLLIRRKRIAEFMLWLFLAGMLTGNYISRNGLIENIEFSALFAPASPYESRIQNKRVTVIGHDPGLFKENFLGGAFFDWELSRRYFEEPDFYEHVIRIHESFEKDPPDVIIDEKNLLPAVLERLPSVSEMYRREGALYWRR